MTDTRNHKIDYIELPAADAAKLAQTKQFYSATFGWDYKDWAPTYVDTQSSGVASGISADAEQPLRAPLVVLFAEDLAAARARVLENKGTITRDIFPFPGGRRFHFADPAGNELAVWSDR
jgi:uncharacterized protein